nr:EOG090X0439 [Macrothrix elegans]
MASELPDALEKLALKAERNESEQASTSLSKYFGAADNGDDIFDAIVKPTKQTHEEPRVSLLKSPMSTPSKEDKEANTSIREEPSFAFVKGEQESEPKIFSYFSQPVSGDSGSKDSDATEFFDQISQIASKTHEPIEISSPSVSTSLPIVVNQTTPQICQTTTTTTANVNAPSHDGHQAVTTSIPSAPQPTTVPLQPQVNSTFQTPSPVVPQAFASLTSSSFTETQQTIQQPISKALEQASFWWIPSKRISSWLQSSGAKQTENLPSTCPGLSNATELTDPMKDLLKHFDGEAAAAERQTLTADMTNAFRAAANLCGRLLTAYGQGYGKLGQPSKHTPHTLQLWFIRFVALMNSNLSELAANEVVAFSDLDTPDLYYDFYPELVREIVRKVDQFATADKMTESERQDALELWKKREVDVMYSLINCAILKKDYYNAVNMTRKLLDLPNQGPRSSLWSLLGRIYLHLGDVTRAQECYRSAASLRDSSVPSDIIASLMDKGLMAIAQNAFEDAYTHYQQALTMQPDNPELVNNTAVCLVYLGRMREAMLLLEENMGTKPETMIRDDTMLNVCTLYELESSLTMQRKMGMLRLASKWKMDNLNVASFKLQTT